MGEPSVLAREKSAIRAKSTAHNFASVGGYRAAGHRGVYPAYVKDRNGTVEELTVRKVNGRFEVVKEVISKNEIDTI